MTKGTGDTFTYFRDPYEVRNKQKVRERGFGMSLPVRLDSVFAKISNGQEMDTIYQQSTKKNW